MDLNDLYKRYCESSDNSEPVPTEDENIDANEEDDEDEDEGDEPSADDVDDSSV